MAAHGSSWYPTLTRDFNGPRFLRAAVKALQLPSVTWLPVVRPHLDDGHFIRAPARSVVAAPETTSRGLAPADACRPCQTFRSVPVWCDASRVRWCGPPGPVDSEPSGRIRRVGPVALYRHLQRGRIEP
jgi:hypothetical protein